MVCLSALNPKYKNLVTMRTNIAAPWVRCDLPGDTEESQREDGETRTSRTLDDDGSVRMAKARLHSCGPVVNGVLAPGQILVFLYGGVRFLLSP